MSNGFKGYDREWLIKHDLNAYNEMTGQSTKPSPVERNAARGKEKGVTLNIKPLSVNEAWQGRRFKTKTYTQFEKSVLILLPNMKLPEPPFEISYEFGMSNICSDIDNPIKPFQDILQKKYGFDDKNIMKIVIKKSVVQRGNEYIYFKITPYEI